MWLMSESARTFYENPLKGFSQKSSTTLHKVSCKNPVGLFVKISYGKTILIYEHDSTVDFRGNTESLVLHLVANLNREPLYFESLAKIWKLTLFIHLTLILVMPTYYTEFKKKNITTNK